MLLKRVVRVVTGKTIIKGRVYRGRPQGGVLSPPLWNLVLVSLIHRLNEYGYVNVAYAHVVILPNGKFGGTICESVHVVLRITEEWCKD